jgi:hypothetical protein
MAVGNLPHAIDEEKDDPKEDKGVEKQENESGQVAADETEDVVVPSVLDLGEGDIGNLILRREEEKEHYGDVSNFFGFFLLLTLGTSIYRAEGLDAKIRI